PAAPGASADRHTPGTRPRRRRRRRWWACSGRLGLGQVPAAVADLVPARRDLVLTRAHGARDRLKDAEDGLGGAFVGDVLDDQTRQVVGGDLGQRALVAGVEDADLGL